MRQLSETLQVGVTPEMRAALHRMAADRRVPVSVVVREILESVTGEQPQRRRRLSQAERDSIVAQLRDGRSVGDVSRSIGVDHKTVRHHGQAAGVISRGVPK